MLGCRRVLRCLKAVLVIWVSFSALGFILYMKMDIGLFVVWGRVEGF